MTQQSGTRSPNRSRRIPDQRTLQPLARYTRQPLDLYPTVQTPSSTFRPQTQRRDQNSRRGFAAESGHRDLTYQNLIRRVLRIEKSMEVILPRIGMKSALPTRWRGPRRFLSDDEQFRWRRRSILCYTAAATSPRTWRGLRAPSLMQMTAGLELPSPPRRTPRLHSALVLGQRVWTVGKGERERRVRGTWLYSPARRPAQMGHAAARSLAMIPLWVVEVVGVELCSGPRLSASASGERAHTGEAAGWPHPSVGKCTREGWAM